MGRFTIRLLLADKSWSTRYKTPENDRWSNSSTQWKLLKLNYPVEKNGTKLSYDQKDTAHADMCFSNNTTTHSV